MATDPEASASHSNPVPALVYHEADMGAAWSRGAAVRSRELGAATALMLDLAGLEVGDRVLDVGAGTGETALLAAERVGPTGHVLATDIAAPMLDIAAEALRRAGRPNVETRLMDARDLDLPSESFDAVISRLTIMLIPDRHRALAEMRRVLKPGGRFAVVVWSTGERNLGSFLPLSNGRRHASLLPPPPDHPGMFLLGPPGLLERALIEAGLRGVSVRAVSTTRSFPSIDAMLQYLTGAAPLLREALSKVDDIGRAAMLDEIAGTMRLFEGPDGVSIPGELLVGGGTR